MFVQNKVPMAEKPFFLCLLNMNLECFVRHLSVIHYIILNHSTEGTCLAFKCPYLDDTTSRTRDFPLTVTHYRLYN